MASAPASAASDVSIPGASSRSGSTRDSVRVGSTVFSGLMTRPVERTPSTTT